jgi:hypothetical protein
MLIIEFIKNHKKLFGVFVILLGISTLFLSPDKTTGYVDGTPALMCFLVGAGLIFYKE